ncbi:hypothetical protein N7490_011161 [Penicillium lividum]|nr:hypothetical protein N7490_011161 [Penicillium lividum]
MSIQRVDFWNILSPDMISTVTETPNAAITTSWSRPPVTHNVPPTSGVRTSGTGMNIEGFSLAQALLMRAELTMHINALTNQLLRNSASAGVPYQVAETSQKPGQERPVVGHKPRMPDTPDTEEGGKKGEYF